MNLVARSVPGGGGAGTPGGGGVGGGGGGPGGTPGGGGGPGGGEGPGAAPVAFISLTESFLNLTPVVSHLNTADGADHVSLWLVTPLQ